MNADIDKLLTLSGTPEDRQSLADVKALFLNAADKHPRGHQVDLGPSEIGTDCLRKLAYGLTATGKCNSFFDPMPSVRGIAMHTWLEQACRIWNDDCGYLRYIPESQVHIREGLDGQCDVYDIDRQIVRDWKNPGATVFKEHQKAIRETGKPRQQYVIQGHTYGRGFVNLGFPVKRVEIVFLTTLLADTLIWGEPYDSTIVDAALNRMDHAKQLIIQHEVREHPNNFALIPATPSDDCRLCPWWSPTPHSARQCAGKTMIPPTGRNPK